MQKKQVPGMVKELFKKDAPAEKLVPTNCKLLYRYAQEAMYESGKAITSEIEEEVFGEVRKLFILREDITSLMEMQELSATCIVVYMR